MQNSALKISENFRKMAVRSVLSIFLFLGTYLLMVVLGLGVILLCGLIAYWIVSLYSTFVTLMLGLGFVSMGLLIFFFLIKFVFTGARKVDRSHLVKVSEKDQPELFKLIEEIVAEVKTPFPKHVYLSSEVNASVFYDSNFWSMFFPVRKNLQIGLGLMNSISAIELKAILAHEFGHFSQRSMKVGSYVYNVNKVIYNMLYDNEGYSTVVEKWGNISSYFVLFAKGAIFVVQGIQWVLVKVHKVLNINYMALSREMEFHADEVAASVAGSAPLANSLLRLDLANSTLSGVFDYYNGKIAEGKKTNNFYPQQSFLLKALSAKEQLPLVDDLPNLSIDAYKKFSKTKLMLDDQWSSHPGTEERVARLMSLNLPVRGDYNGMAINLLQNRSEVEEMITQKLFETVTYEQEPVLIGMDEFSHDYAELERDRYPIIFRGYFDQRNLYVDFTDEDFQHPLVDDALSFEEIFGESSAADINSLVIAVSDKITLERIDDGLLDIKTFDYDGVKYSSADVPELIKFLEGEILSLEKTLDERDKDVFRFFLTQAVENDELSEFKDQMLSYKSTYEKMKSQQQVYIDLINGTQFLQRTTPLSEIAWRVEEVKKLEVPFKEEIRLMLEDPDYAEMIDAEMRARFDEYLSHNWKYFANDMYFDKELEVLFAALGDFYSVAFKLHFKLKKTVLEFQAGMIENRVISMSAAQPKSYIA